mmetsp:Transcript_11316/g.26627  ORF Transcript_11316/g.26627 Transcript_11316/m.26627 type:complete len:311 (-) Transcript_11316:94-1026(-)
MAAAECALSSEVAGARHLGGAAHLHAKIPATTVRLHRRSPSTARRACRAQWQGGASWVGASKPALVTRVGKAKVGVEHHLFAQHAVRCHVSALPLILCWVVGHLLGHPALGQDGNEVVVVELTAVFRVAPEAVIARVFDLGTAEGVHGHEGRGLAPAQAHLLDEDLVDSSAAVLWVRQPAVGKAAARNGAAAVLEVRLEVQRPRVQAVCERSLPREGHDGLGRQHEEVSDGDLCAVVAPSLGDRDAKLPRVHACGEAGVVRVREVHAAVAATAFRCHEIHEVMPSYAEDAPGKVGLLASSCIAGHIQTVP